MARKRVACHALEILRIGVIAWTRPLFVHMPGSSGVSLSALLSEDGHLPCNTEKQEKIRFRLGVLGFMCGCKAHAYLMSIPLQRPDTLIISSLVGAKRTRGRDSACFPFSFFLLFSIGYCLPSVS